MSIWSLTGAELSREINQPAPVTVLRGGHNGGVAGILSQIAALPPAERDSLLRAFQAALKPEPKRLGGGNSYKDAESFYKDFNIAREAARNVAGAQWYLDPAVSLKARVPSIWVALHGEQGIWRSPRDVNCPRAEFWPSGTLPVGPDYAEHENVCPIGSAWAEREEPSASGKRYLGVNRKGQPVYVPAFDLDYTPESIDAAEAA